MRRLSWWAAAMAIALLVLASAAVAPAQSERVRVAVYEARGVGPRAIATAMATLDDERGVSGRRISPAEVRGGSLADADVVLFTGGRATVQGRLLEAAGRERVREFVRAGGGYVGICAGAYLAMQGNAQFHKLGLVAAHNLTGNRWRRGSRATAVAPGDGSAPATLHYENGPLFRRSPTPPLAPYVVLATFDADVYWARYDTRPGEMPGTPAVVAARFGRGRVVLFSPNPTMDPARGDLFVRAVRWAARGGEVPAELTWRDVFGR